MACEGQSGQGSKPSRMKGLGQGERDLGWVGREGGTACGPTLAFMLEGIAHLTVLCLASFPVNGPARILEQLSSYMGKT